LTLASTSSGGEFATSAGGAEVSSVDIAAGQESVTIYYGDTVAGVATMSVAASGLDGATQLETTIPGAPSSIVIVTTPFSVAVNTPFSIGAQVVDAFGNDVAVSGVTISLSSALNTVSGATTVSTGADGSASFADLSIAIAGLYELSVSASSLPSTPVPSLLVTVFTITTSPASPSAPVAQSSSPSVAGAVTLSWTAPDDGGSSITGYTITPFDETLGVSETPITVTGHVTSVTIADLTPGDAFVFSVTASNAIGSSAPSPSSNFFEPVSAQPSISVSASSLTESGTVTASAGGTASVGSISVSATGRGTISAARYSTPPIPNAPSSLAYYDVAVSPGSSFTVVSFEICGVEAGGSVQWQNPIDQTFVDVSEQAAASSSTGCDVVTLSATSTPSIAELLGSIFAVPLNSSSSATPSYAGRIVISRGVVNTLGAVVTYRARFVSGGSSINTGTVTFKVGATLLCRAKVEHGLASCTSTRAPRAGSLVVTATYTGAKGRVLQVTRGRIIIVSRK
jgi:hypothetical protein